jgi:hypothetical protein
MNENPFVPYRLEEDREKDKSKVFTVRLNLKEQEMAKELMTYFNVKSPATALKYAAMVGYRVLHTVFGEQLLTYLFKKDRGRLEDYEDLKKFKDKKL